MNSQNRRRLLFVIGLMPLFAACGGGGADDSRTPPNQGQASTPTPASPTPAPPAVVIFSSPTPETYASLGSSTTSAGNGYSPPPGDRLTEVSLEAIDQPLLRYTSSGRYEIKLPGAEFDRLVHYKGYVDPTPENNFFQPSRARQNFATFTIVQSRLTGFRYSELAFWTDSTAMDRVGWLAFGTPTIPTAVAATGSATYRGSTNGMVDIAYFDELFGGSYFSGCGGSVTLTVDFAARTISGTLELRLDSGAPTTVPFMATMPQGAETSWGMFETSESGFNELKVRLTGPDASELIGSWAIPVVVNGQPHQVMGAWIAARQ